MKLPTACEASALAVFVLVGAVNGGAKSVHMAAQEPAGSTEFFDPTIASLFGLVGTLLRPGLRSPQPARAAAVKEARRAPRSGA